MPEPETVVEATCAECGIAEPIDGNTLHNGQIMCIIHSYLCTDETCEEITL